MSSPHASTAATSPRSSNATRERILDEAEVLFANSGFAGTSVRDIATAAGLTPASLYNHFSNKDALYRAVLARGVEPLIERLGQLSESQDLRETAPHIIEGVMEHLAAHSHLPRLIALEAATGGEHLSELARDWIRPMIERGKAAIESEWAAGHSPWTPDEASLVITAWLHLVFGHFSMAPLLKEVLGRDPLSKECLADQSRFLLKLARVMAMPRERRVGENRTMTDLASRDFVPFTSKTPTLKGEPLSSLAKQLGNDWAVIEDHHLEKRYGFTNFRDALAFTNRVGELAESMNHHPDVELGWGRVKLTIWSHDAGGLTESDFIWAAKADALL
ncbi:MAG: 4a-hydroxytetrahydrobiopterin dehydratase [Myxococcales bacterium]|nr:4a-hydroxytetrahydrobiopterin dehydratase [Myxococcales bacterium]